MDSSLNSEVQPVVYRRQSRTAAGMATNGSSRQAISSLKGKRLKQFLGKDVC